MVLSRRVMDLQTEISEQHHQEFSVEGEFSQSEKARSLREKFYALETDERLFRKQAEFLSTDCRESGKLTRRVFIELFTSRIGLSIINTTRGRRDESVQSQFRTDCIEAYNNRNPDPRENFFGARSLRIKSRKVTL